MVKFIDRVPLFNACQEKEAFEKRSQQLEQGQWSRYPISKDDIHDQEKKKNRRTVRQRTAEAKYLPNASITADKYWPTIVGHPACGMTRTQLSQYAIETSWSTPEVLSR